MVENITDSTISQPRNVPKPQNPDALIDNKDLKGILFLGVKGNIDASVINDETEVDFLI